ncbi:hypothetical protein [Mesorhizobium sp.]|uniref:hypothetical protein n=1 Tax=Mesorhizobium sp. TaxID=1871066 RepID=UPI0025FFE77D|nr:hypothetical protein [Mesorhizobium sp.]
MAAIETMSTRSSSDEAYVLGLCDDILGQLSERQKRFDFLRGDPGKIGRARRLPVDAFYPGLMLAIEYRETQHSTPVSHFEKSFRLTVSGVHRGEQRRLTISAVATYCPHAASGWSRWTATICPTTNVAVYLETPRTIAR